ncbi:MAG: HD domain-containing phosphohydrolase [Alphaproteobacteria bacterium]
MSISENGGLVLYDRNNKLIALSTRLGQAKPMSEIQSIDIPALTVFASVLDATTPGELLKTEGGDVDFFISKEAISYAGMDFYIGAVAPVGDFTKEFIALQNRVLLISLVSLLLFIPFSYVFASNLSKKVTDLTGAANRMREMDFNVQDMEMSYIVEFDELIHSFSDMSHTLGDKTEQLNVSQAKLSRLVDLGISMAAEQSSDKLMETVLLGAKDLTNADGCSLYVIDENEQLEFKIFRNDSLGISFGGTAESTNAFANIPLYNEDGSQNVSNVVSFAVHEEKTINIENVENSLQFDFTGPRSFDAKANYKTVSILTVPLKPRGGSVIGALQIVNARDKETGEFIPFSEEVQPFVEALAAQAATSLYNRHLLVAQEALMDALILLIAEAIDSKSPYTGGHCERVPILAMKLAEKASEGSAGSYADFKFKTRDEWREFEIGAWLHDCGKIVTPEYVVDKASKLETIYNRIHEIRTRFEVLLRDARIECLQAIVDGEDRDGAEAKFETRKQTLVDDFAFVAECNIGAEFMHDDDIDRLKRIAETVWQRNFDIRFGLAHEEALRFADAPDAPCSEKLLDDKAYHIIPRTRDDAARMAEWGFKTEVPDDLYNQGEVYNLSIRRGTLTAEERFKINEHIMQSIIMLERLPLPNYLKRVPEYAGTHHETLIGTGYPRKLTAAELSVPARITAIADIFEALTASDRPYKKAKTLSQAVDILSNFKKDQHIDADLFDLFLTSGVYREYAEMFLAPEQIDDVDIAQYLG